MTITTQTPAATEGASDIAKVRAIIERVNRKGGLGYDVHAWLADALALLATPAPAVGASVQPVPVAIQSLIDDLMLEAERFWWNDGPEGKTADAMNAAKAKLLEAVQPVQASLSDEPPMSLIDAIHALDIHNRSAKQMAVRISQNPGLLIEALRGLS